jgi:hypothetical protein
MFDQTEIRFNIGRAMFWLTLTTGICVLVVNLFTYRPGLGLLGLALLMASCGIATRRAISDHDRAMHAAFELGRDHERLQNVRTL